MHKAILGFLFIIVLVSGCAQRGHNLSIAEPLQQPIVEVHRKPGSDIASAKTFTIIPPYAVSEDANLRDSIQTEQILFELRNMILRRGYKYVSPDSKQPADLIVTLDGNIEYKEHYIPPRQVRVPVWVPGQTVIANTYSSGTASAYGSGGYAYGNYSGTSTTIAQSSGYLSSQVVTTPAQVRGYYYPAYSIAMLDSRTNEIVLEGSGAAVTKASDLRIAGQTVLAWMLEYMPLAKHIDELYPEITQASGIGVSFYVYTVDGNNFFPNVQMFRENGPARSAGLRRNDFIIAVDGQSTRNLDVPNIYRMIRGPDDTTVKVTVFRTGQTLTFDLERMPVPEMGGYVARTSNQPSGRGQ